MAGKYRVIEAFSDLQDNEHIYHPGDYFPRDGYDVSIDRLTSLAGSTNKRGKPMIELVNDEPTLESIPAADPEEAPPTDGTTAVEKPKTKRSKKR